jgi:hypothetical protein
MPGGGETIETNGIDVSQKGTQAVDAPSPMRRRHRRKPVVRLIHVMGARSNIKSSTSIAVIMVNTYLEP